MRKKHEVKLIVVREEIYQKLVTDRKKLQEVIGGGKWSLSDTINYYQEIIHRDINERK